MRKGRKVQYVLNANNVEALEERSKGKQPLETYLGLLLLAANVCDHAIAGEDIYMTIGMTRDRSGLLLVITWGEDKSYLAAGSLAGLSDEARDWVAAE